MRFIKFFIVAAFIFCFPKLSFAQTVQVPQNDNRTYKGDADRYFHYVGPDIDLQVGTGYHWDTADKSRDTVLGMGRLRLGVLYVPTYPWALSAGITSELNSNSVMVWGVQGEIMQINSGLWLRSGIGADYYVRPHFNVAAGWSFFGAELQTVSTGDVAPNALNDHREGVALLGTIRIPIGFIIYAFDKK